MACRPDKSAVAKKRAIAGDLARMLRFYDTVVLSYVPNEKLRSDPVVSKAVQALEITWSPKNDTGDDPSNTYIVHLGKEP